MSDARNRRKPKHVTVESLNDQQRELLFRQGYYCAVANIIRTHGEVVVARDVLMNFGKFDPVGIDPGDHDLIYPLACQIARHLSPRAARKEGEVRV